MAQRGLGSTHRFPDESPREPEQVNTFREVLREFGLVIPEGIQRVIPKGAPNLPAFSPGRCTLAQMLAAWLRKCSTPVKAGTACYELTTTPACHHPAE